MCSMLNSIPDISISSNHLPHDIFLAVHTPAMLRERMLPTMPLNAEHSQLCLIRGWTSPLDYQTIDADPCDVMLVALKRLQLTS